MGNKVIDPSKLEGRGYKAHGKCIVEFRDTHEWRKAEMVGSTWVYETFKFRFEPDSKSSHFPEGGEVELSLDNRWNMANVIDLRMVPEEMWDWDVPSPHFTEYELLARNLRARLNKGEKLRDESDVALASDWRKVCVGNDAKYCNVMYSPSLDVMRKQTFSEFYGGGIVD